MVAWARNGRETPAERRYNPAFQQEPTCSGWAISPTHSGHSTGAALDLTLVDLKADNSAAFDPGKAYADCTAPAEARARRKAASTWAPAMIVPIVKAHTARGIDHAGPAPLAQPAGGRDGEARFCELFEGVVALFAAGRGRAGL